MSAHYRSGSQSQHRADQVREGSEQRRGIREGVVAVLATAVLAGRTVRVMGSADQPHSFTYLPDYARAMIAAAADRAAWGSVLHAPTGPALSQRALITAFADAAGTRAQVGTVPSWLVRAGALVPGTLRELNETLYQFTGPFIMDSSASEGRLGLSPTPLEEAVRDTLAWWRAQLAARA